MTFKESFDSAKNWIKELKENSNVPDPMIALIGNKSDLIGEAQVNSEEIYEYAREIKADINKETSAKENQGISDLFLEISTKLYKKHKLKVSITAYYHHYYEGGSFIGRKILVIFLLKYFGLINKILFCVCIGRTE